jgi:transcriptional antiterminator RfaH
MTSDAVNDDASVAPTPCLRSLPNTPPQPWYVCLTKPRQEQYAASKLQEQGFEVYLPLLTSWAKLGGDWRKKYAVMFPRYAFVRPGNQGQAIGPARSTPGVNTLVRFGHVLACLREDRLSGLRALVAAQSAQLPEQPFQAGTAVIFAAGPLKGASGIVSGVASERVQVLMTLLGQEQVVRVSARDLACV